ncbi:MAG: hypothetical protein EBZ93_02525 [Actinobacteria bacterium]|nr:hypothetical protein [Actinomycetota bacterium]
MSRTPELTAVTLKTKPSVSAGASAGRGKVTRPPATTRDVLRVSRSRTGDDGMKRPAREDVAGT